MRQGKVRAIGASNYSAGRLAQALRVSKDHKFPRYESLQPLYNLYDRTPFEEDLEPLCLKEGLGVITYYSLASGFLTGKYRSQADLAQSQRGTTVKKYLDDRGQRILQALDQIAARYRSSPARVALAWLQGPPERYRPHRERNERRPARRPRRIGTPRTGCRQHGNVEQGERMALVCGQAAAAPSLASG